MRISLLIVIMFVCSACNLSLAPPTPTPDDSTQPPTFLATATSDDMLPTRLPLPGVPETAVPVTNVPLLGDTCEVYTTYSGARADNTLSLRAGPSTETQQIFRVPNNIEVWRVPGSQEVEAEGYHWLNVIYEAPSQTRYIGWVARDSFEVNGVRDPSVETLRPAGSQAPC